MRKGICFAALLFTALVSDAEADLLAHLTFTQSGSTFTYTLFNDEPLASPNFISLFHLEIDAPVSIIETPAGWDYATDDVTYIDWFSTSFESPYEYDLAPGASFTFVIESAEEATEFLPFSASAWDHVVDTSGPSYTDFVLAPSGQAVPEPSSLILLGIGSLGVIAYPRRTEQVARGR